MNLIALSGYAGSGKDTVGAIIQYLITEENKANLPTISAEDIVKEHSDNEWWLEEQSGWELKSFAAKLKKIASLLTGIPIEKFNDEEFKKSVLSKEWSNPRGLTIDERDPLTVREFLQKLGTDAIRNHLHENVWINALFANYNQTHITKGIKAGPQYPNWIITDCRFPNEAEEIRKRGGIVVRVNRSVDSSVLRGDNQWIKLEGHSSEIAMDRFQFDWIIENTSSISALIEKVKEMLIHFKIINNGVS